MFSRGVMLVNQPDVSVLMPAHNVEEFIAEAIQSILSQTLINFELIVLDDGSIDKTRTVIDQFNDPRITKIYWDKNNGLVSARRKLVELAKGSFIAFLDADDIANPERLQIQFEYLKKNKNVDICGTDHYTLNFSTGAIKSSKQLHSDSDIRALLTVSSPLCNPSIMARSEIFKSFSYDSSASLAEDYGMWVQLALAGYHFVNLPQKLITYRLHDDQISRQEGQTGRSFFKIFQNQYLRELGIPDSLSPTQMRWQDRLTKGPLFLKLLNSRIKKISFLANYQIYARFQFRHNGIYTPITRLERFIAALVATVSGRFISK